MARRSSLIHCIILFLLSVPGTAQQSYPVTMPDGTRVEVFPRSANNGEQLVLGKRILQAESPESQNNEKRLIVEFRDPPLARVYPNRIGTAARELNEAHRRFLMDLTTMQRGRNLGVHILFEYKHVLNGYVVMATHEDEKRIRELPYVKSVSEDRKVFVENVRGYELIGADKVWKDYGLTGKNIRIGIIDTGIDYMHPDLGGGFGADRKVIGGYDFVNDDDDPMDDHGHGTHVAGIAAGNGHIKGVAPDAKLVAYKVLSAEGWGWDSWIVAAIERAADPDGDPLTMDALEVVNMSLGRRVDRFDPYSEAIANATLKGVTFVVSAGNNARYGSVSTPGVSKDAITVGACEFNEEIAWFSSKGPVIDGYLIKPDVIAPGSRIFSTGLNGTYFLADGTSMASPHVAGAAALLKEKYPLWDAAQIKAALMNTAGSNAADVWSSGAGLINVHRALSSSFTVSPGSISLGRITGESKTRTVTMTIANLSDEPKTFSFSGTGFLSNEGTSVSFEPQSITVAPGVSGKVDVSIILLPEVLPRLSFINGHFGGIRIISAADAIDVPVTAVHSPSTFLHFSKNLPQAVFIAEINDLRYSDVLTPQSETIELLVPPGKYDVFAMYASGNVYAEDIDISFDNEIDMKEGRIEHEVTYDYVDPDGKAIVLEPGDFGASVVFTRGWTSVVFKPGTKSRFSENKYTKHSSIFFDERDTRFYSIPLGTPPGFSASTALRNDPEGFVKISSAVSATESQIVSRSFNPSAPWGGVLLFHDSPLEQPEFYAGPRTDDTGFATNLVLTTPDGDTWNSGFYAPKGGRTMNIDDGALFPEIYAVHQGDEYVQQVGIGTLRCRAQLVSESGSYSLHNYQFVFPGGEYKRGPVAVQWKETSAAEWTFNNMVQETSRFTFAPLRIDLPEFAQAFDVRLTYEGYSLNGKSGKAQMTFFAEPAQEDNTPPVLGKLSVKVGNIETSAISEGDNATLDFSIFDCVSAGGKRVCGSGIARVEVHIRSSLGATEIFTFENPVLDSLSVDLSGLMSDDYDLVITATDQFSNAFTYELSPAFFIGPGDRLSAPQLLLPSNGYRYASHSPAFSWSDVQGAKVYTLAIATSDDFDNQQTFEVFGEYFEFPMVLDAQSKYFWRVKSGVESTEGDWSSVFEFNTRGDDFATLILPVSGSMIDGAVTFLWTDAADAYQFEIGKDEAFTKEVRRTIEKTFSRTYDGLAPGTYFWRVKTLFSDGVHEQTGPYSDVFSFTVLAADISGPVRLTSPSNGYLYVRHSPTFRWNADHPDGEFILRISPRADFGTYEEYHVEGTSFIYPAELPELTTYFWKVRPKADGSSDNWSDVFSFQTRTNVAPTILSPVKGENVIHSNITFRWTEVAESYRIIIASDSSMRTVLVDQVQDGTTRNQYLVSGKKYYWVVQSVFGNGAEPEMGARSLVTPFFVTGTFDLISPANGQTEVDVHQTSFRWTALENAISYTVHVSPSSAFNNDVKVAATSQTNVDFNTLENGRVYYWKVAALLSDEKAVISPTFSFTTSLVTEIEKGQFTHGVYAVPNPASNEVNIVFETQTPGIVTFAMVDVHGRIVGHRKEITSDLGVNSLLVNLSGIADGVYYVSLNTNGQTEMVKLIVRK